MARNSFDPLRKQAFGMIGGLTLEYLLGLTTTIFVKFPENANEGKLWEFAWKQISLASHIILGIFLLIGSGIFVFRAYRAKNQVWLKASLVGFFAIFIAGFGGSRFIPTQTDAYSFVMGLSFLVALFAYGLGAYLSKTSA